MMCHFFVESRRKYVLAYICVCVYDDLVFYVVSVHACANMCVCDCVDVCDSVCKYEIVCVFDGLCPNS